MCAAHGSTLRAFLTGRNLPCVNLARRLRAGSAQRAVMVMPVVENPSLAARE
ncbi:MAG: hypothetical protein IH891_02080 [Planctomycetes bacterium]|nr:hypothetical protein [Planctomycetota bacterium]